MLKGVLSKQSTNSLMSDYANLLGDAVLRTRTHEAEQTAQIQAELASRVKSEFIANMSHELRTPLNTVIGFSKIMSEHGERKIPDEVIVEYANLIQQAASHLLSVINDILDISKIQSGKYTLDDATICLNATLDGTVHAVQSGAESAGVRLVQRIDKNLPQLRGDKSKLLQIFLALLDNAVKFTQAGGTVTIKAVRMPDDYACVTITDTGVGMTDEEIQLALEPFAQVDGTRTRWREGTGLGLPIAKALIELHGGYIKIASTKGRGTSIHVKLPSHNDVTAAHGSPTKHSAQLPDTHTQDMPTA